ncbi:gliding motility-associated C-terminal domain-containing protein [Adhaeribacter terreus]|uniref:Gliding motility-associated C-terminal domain-containing protein n=1 Tax=Adhaeribacter terreus TaxID=529703 RepID=A0ABW0E7U6_9BACT
MKKCNDFFPVNWPNSIVLIVLLFFFILDLKGQTPPAIQWDKTFGGSDYDGLYSLQQTSDGGYILGGTSSSNISGDKSQVSRGNTDYWVVKLDSSGNKMWDKTFGGSNKDELFPLHQTSDGGYILGGYSDSGIYGDKSQANRGFEDYWIVKLDANGNKIWDKTFGGSERDILSSLQQTSDGGYILGGYSYSSIGSDKSQANIGSIYSCDYWIIKLDANGNKIWDRTFGGSYSDRLHSLQQTSDGGYILGGYSDSGSSGDKSQANRGREDFWVVRLDANGNKIWDKTFGGSERDEILSLQQTFDGGYILGGYSKSGISGDKGQASRGSDDYWIVKLDVNGNKLWDKTFGGNDSDVLFSLKQTSDGGYILGGYSSSAISGDKSQSSQGNVDYWVVKLDASGSKQWDKTIGGSNLNFFYSLQQASDGGFILGGRSDSGVSRDKSQPSKGGLDIWVVKLAPPCVLSPIVTNGSNCGAGSVTLSATGAPSGGNYAWYNVATGGVAIYINPSGTFATPNLSATTTYYVAVVNNVGCEGPRTEVTATIKPVLQFSLGQDIEACEGDAVILKTDKQPGVFLWSDGSADSTLTVYQSGKYWVKFMLNDCVTSDTVQVTFKHCQSTLSPNTWLPNIITPNNDSWNETFKISALPAGKWQLQIYNRWGVKLFEAEDYRNNWPDKKIADGTYYYLLRNPETGKQYKGWVEVVQ